MKTFEFTRCLLFAVFFYNVFAKKNSCGNLGCGVDQCNEEMAEKTRCPVRARELERPTIFASPEEIKAVAVLQDSAPCSQEVTASRIRRCGSRCRHYGSKSSSSPCSCSCTSASSSFPSTFSKQTESSKSSIKDIFSIFNMKSPFTSSVKHSKCLKCSNNQDYCDGELYSSEQEKMCNKQCQEISPKVPVDEIPISLLYSKLFDPIFDSKPEIEVNSDETCKCKKSKRRRKNDKKLEKALEREKKEQEKHKSNSDCKSPIILWSNLEYKPVGGTGNMFDPQMSKCKNNSPCATCGDPDKCDCSKTSTCPMEDKLSDYIPCGIVRNIKTCEQPTCDSCGEDEDDDDDCDKCDNEYE